MGNTNAQTALVTGAAQGIGFGIAQEFARAGSRVIIADKNTQKAAAAAQEISAAGHEAVAIPLDVTSDESVRDCVRASIERFARIDVLVNNAGIHSEQIGSPATIEQFIQCFDVNLFGVWRMVQELLPHFKANRGGKIVNIASIAGRTPYAETPAYCASKAALINLTRALAYKLGADDINVNAVCPGAVMTPMNEAFRHIMPNMEEAQLLAQVIKRPLKPEDMGRAAVFLASAQARNITGQCLNVDAGCVMS